MTESHQVSVERWVQMNEIGETVYGGFVICRGCGAGVPITIQSALKAHLAACAPLRSSQ